MTASRDLKVNESQCGYPTLFNLSKKILRKDKYWHNQLRKASMNQSIDLLATNDAIYCDSLFLTLDY